MFYRRQGYFYRLSKYFPFIKYFDIYDPQSFIRENILDNIIVCMLVYCLYYFGLWYADKVIKQIEKVNEKIFTTMLENKPKLEDLITLKRKRLEYEDVVIKNKELQRQTEKYLDNECEKLTSELTITETNICELEKFFGKCKSMGSSFNTGKPISGAEGEFVEDIENGVEKPEENIKILEPSFPPPLPPEPPPRKYGIFVARPPGHRVTPGCGPPPAPPVPKIGFKLSSLG